MTVYNYFESGASSNFPLERITQSADGLSWSNPVQLTIDGSIDGGAADPNVLALSNGEFLLTYTQGNDVIYTAISTDGVNFTSAQPAFSSTNGAQITNQTEVQLNNGTFLMGVSSPSTDQITFYTSIDGRNYVPSGTTLTEAGSAGNVVQPSDLMVLPDGSVRIFYAGSGGIVSEISHDNGQTWQPEVGLRLIGSQYTDPSVVETAPGQWEMVVTSAINSTGLANPSNDQESLATSTDGINFTITQPNFAVQAGVGDIVATPAIGSASGPSASSMSAAVGNNATAGAGANATVAITGEPVTVTLNTNVPVTVTGIPTLQLNDNEVAIYTSGSGTNTLTFTYTVQAADNSSDLQVTGLNLSGGAAIVDDSGHGLSGNVTGDLGIQINTTTVQQEILGLYAALYGRAADSGGLSFWAGLVGEQPDGAGVTAANAGATAVTLNDTAVLGQAFVNTQATFFDATYGSLNDSQFVNALYVNLGGNAGDPGGIAFWANILAQSEAGGQSVQAARAALVGQFVDDLVDVNLAAFTTLTPAQLLAAEQRQATIDNKIAVSLALSNASQQTGGSILVPHTVGDAAFQADSAVIQGVTYDPATVTAAITGINAAVAAQNLHLI
jgi:hypothetical protein